MDNPDLTIYGKDDTIFEIKMRLLWQLEPDAMYVRTDMTDSHAIVLVLEQRRNDDAREITDAQESLAQATIISA